MREIVHIQAGQCGNQIGAKVCNHLRKKSSVGLFRRTLDDKILSEKFFGSCQFSGEICRCCPGCLDFTRRDRERNSLDFCQEMTHWVSFLRRKSIPEV